MGKIIFKYFTVTAFLFFILPVIASAQVVISEIMYDPDGLDSGREWIEVTNTGENPVDISGWKFRENSINHSLNVISGVSVLSGGQSAIIADNANTFISENPTFSGNLFDSSFSLSNSGERLSVLNNSLEEVDYVNYLSDWGASGTDESLHYETNFGGWLVDLPNPGFSHLYQDEELPYLYVGKKVLFATSSNPNLIKANLIFSNGFEMQPGAILRFKKGASMITNENQTFEIIGTKENPIIFTSDEPSPISGDYDGLIVSNGVVVNMQNVEFHYARKAIDFLGSSLSIKDSKFVKNKTGVDVANLRDVDIKNSSFEGNNIGVLHRGGVFPTIASSNLQPIDSGEVPKTNILISVSSFKNNSLYAVKNEDENGLSLIDAKSNFWGDSSGPRHISNSLGVGNKVSDAVLFVPWLTEEPNDTTCIQNCFSSIMFIPGLEASRLYKPDYNGGTDTLWEPNRNEDVEQLFLDDNGKTIRQDIYTRDVVEEVFGVLGNIYKTFLGELSKWKNDENIIADYSIVPYDWRLTVDEILNYGNLFSDGRIYYSGDLRDTEIPFIIKELKRLAESSKNGKVSIVAHSKGGIIAKALLKKLEESGDPLINSIDKVFLVAVPQIGTPEAIGALLHGFEQAHFPVINEFFARKLGKNMPSAYSLLPSLKYFDYVETSPIKFADSDFSEIGKAVENFGMSISSKDNLWSFLKGDEGRNDATFFDVSSPAVLNNRLLTYADELHQKIDNWIPGENIKIYQIAGWGEETLSGLEYRTKEVCENFVKTGNSFSCSSVKKTWTYKPKMVIDGDGTVVAPSALFMSTSTPNVERWWVNLYDYNDKNFPNLEHKNILEIPQLLNLVKNKIKNVDESLQFISDSIFISDTNEERINFYLHSPLDLSALDKDGNLISSTTSNIKGARYKKMGEIQYLSIPKSLEPVLSLRGISSGSFDLDIEEYLGGVIVATTTFASVPSSTSTLATINFNNGGSINNASDLVVDYEGDGDADFNLKPEVGSVVTLPPPDVEAPEIIVGFSTTTNRIKMIGFDNVSTSTKMELSRNVATSTDDSLNYLRLNFSEINKNNQEFRIDINKMFYSTTTQMERKTFAIARYYRVLKNPNKGPLIFSSYLFSPEGNVLSVYNSSINKTNIFVLTQSVYDVGLSNIVNKIPKNAIIKETRNGLVIPYFETQKGKIIIKY